MEANLPRKGPLNFFLKNASGIAWSRIAIVCSLLFQEIVSPCNIDDLKLYRTHAGLKKGHCIFAILQKEVTCGIISIL